MLHRVCLSVGNVVVTGEGPSPQAARHHAARQALELLRQEIQKNEAKGGSESDEKYECMAYCSNETSSMNI